MKAPLAITLGDKDAERVRRDHARAITELQSAVSTLDGASGRYLGRLVITSSGSGALTTGTTHIVLRMIGSGGGGGGAGSTGTAYGCGGGGGSGVYLEASVTVPTGAGYVAAIGAPGTGGNSSGGTGGTGGSATLQLNGVTYTATGGLGGTGSNNATAVDVPGGGQAAGSSGGDFYGGWRGMRGFILSSATFPGDGAGSPFGEGGVASHGAFGDGSAASGYGAGGGGGNGGPSNNHVGGAGSPGLIVIDQYA